MFLLLTLKKFHILFWCIFSPLRRSKRHLGIFGNPYLCNILTNIYLFKVNNNMFKINSNVVLVFVFLLWGSICLLGWYDATAKTCFKVSHITWLNKCFQYWKTTPLKNLFIACLFIHKVKANFLFFQLVFLVSLLSEIRTTNWKNEKFALTSQKLEI